MISPDDVLEYWFGDLTNPEAAPATVSRWFKGGPEVDEEIRARFGDALEPARRGELDAWAATPRGALALLILLDQFPRNVHRDDPRSFASDEHARHLARISLEREDDQAVFPVQSTFFYLPFEHSEAPEDQRLAVDKIRASYERAKGDARKLLEQTVDYAERHQQVIKRFGRFPHRNQILGRPSTPEELEFLKEPGSSF
jgi:uncharacterized protein (DUF924 family)